MAAEALSGALAVRGQRVRLQWGKARAERAPGGARAGAQQPAEPQAWDSAAGPFGEPAFYPSMDPSAMGARPERDGPARKER